MGYVHVEINTSQLSKKPGKPCGDVVYYDRTENAATIILCDGLGSGIKANIYATMYAERIKELLAQNFSMRETFAHLVKTVSEAPRMDYPYAAFSICRILNNGLTTILSYEMPPPILITGKYPVILDQKSTSIENSVITEVNYTLRAGDQLLVVSDGVVQSGMGGEFIHGWGSEGVREFVFNKLKEGEKPAAIPELIKREALRHYGNVPKDDITAILIKIRKGTVVNILTGPPAKEEMDEEVIKRFMKQKGYKIICGGSSAKIAARITGKKLTVEEDFDSQITPPKYYLEGVDLVTEGAVTLNQVYNILDADTTKMDKRSPVAQLYHFLYAADRINFIAGTATNPVTGDISFTQLRILPRLKIIKLLAEELRRLNKLVTINYI